MKFPIKNLFQVYAFLNFISVIISFKNQIKSQIKSNNRNNAMIMNSNSASFSSSSSASSASTSQSEFTSLSAALNSNNLKSMTANKALMNSYFLMNNKMKSHTKKMYNSERGQLDFMMAFTEMGVSHKKHQIKNSFEENPLFKRHEGGFKSASTKRFNFRSKTEDDSINNYSFKAQEKELESELLKMKERGDAAQAGNSTAGDSSKGNSTGGNSSGEILEDWWMFNSNELKDGAKYPLLQVPNKTVSPKVGDQGFRYNEAINCTSGKPENAYLFYFRLADSGLFYGATKTDVNILGFLTWEIIDDAVDIQEYFNKTKIYCIHINDRENRNWKICHKDESVYKKWYCKIKNTLEIEEPMCKNNKTENGTLKAEKKVIKVQPEVIIPLPSRECNENWNYNKQGKDWECICKEGLEQSPIDLPKKEDAIDSPIRPLFEYKEINAILAKTTIDEMNIAEDNLEMRNDNGLLIIYEENIGKIVTLDGAVYRAEEITFHTPSNHKIDGKSFPLEISIIHYGETVGDIAKQVVLNFLFEKKAGVYNKFIDDLDIFNIPNPITKKTNITNSLFVPKIFYNSEDTDLVVFKPFSFYTYQGSLAFPPCTERTINYVTSTPLQIGTTVLQLFQEALRTPDLIKKKGDKTTILVSDNLPSSSREVQELNGRPVFHYDHTKYCFENPQKPKPQPVGHYEKMPRDVEKIFYVSGNKPSGIPGAFVIPTEEVEGEKK